MHLGASTQHRSSCAQVNLLRSSAHPSKEEHLDWFPQQPQLQQAQQSMRLRCSRQRMTWARMGTLNGRGAPWRQTVLGAPRRLLRLISLARDRPQCFSGRSFLHQSRRRCSGRAWVQLLATARLLVQSCPSGRWALHQRGGASRGAARPKHRCAGKSLKCMTRACIHNSKTGT